MEHSLRESAGRFTNTFSGVVPSLLRASGFTLAGNSIVGWTFTDDRLCVHMCMHVCMCVCAHQHTPSLLSQTCYHSLGSCQLIMFWNSGENPFKQVLQAKAMELLYAYYVHDGSCSLAQNVACNQSFTSIISRQVSHFGTSQKINLLFVFQPFSVYDYTCYLRLLREKRRLLKHGSIS